MGVILDTRLGWTPHLRAKIAAAKQLLSVLTNGVGRLWGPKTQYMKWIYTSVLTPIITYGAIVWSAGCQRQVMQKELQKLQNQIIRRTAYTRRSTPMRAAAIILGMTPLHIAIELEAKRTLLRQVAEQGLPTLILRNRTKFRTHIEWLSGRLPFQMLEMAQTEHERPVLIRPAYRTIPQHDPHPTYWDGDITVYTDGSKHVGGTGAGFCYWTKEDKEAKRYGIRLRAEATIFQAEMVALLEAAKHVETEVLPNLSNVQTITLRTDSQAAINALAKVVSRDKWVRETKEVLNRLSNGRQVHLEWVRGHSGYVGNCIADAIARQASGLDRNVPSYGEAITFRDVDTPTGYHELKGKLTQQAIEQWTTEWTQSSDCRQAKVLIRAYNKIVSKNIISKSREECGRIIRFFTGHAHLQRHNRIVDGEGPANCRLCEQEEETPIHVLFQCPRLISLRVQHIQAYVVENSEIHNFYDHRGLLTLINDPIISAMEVYPEEN